MASFKIALSAGHGKNTAGKRCMKSLDPNETREWALNSRIAEKIEDLLLEYTDCDLLRLDDRTGAKDIALSTRSKSANAWGADLYLALHHNAGVRGGKGGGIVAYIHTKPSTDELEWQKALYNALIEATGLRGNRSNPLSKANFHEVREPKMTAVLLELGFMDSKTDVPIILSDAYADKCAKAIVQVIVQRGKLAKKDGSTEKESSSTSTTTPAPAPQVKLDAAKQFNKAKAGAYVVQSSDGCLNLRAGAAASKQLIETMKNGTKVRCYGYYTGSWLYVVSAAGNKGFCHSAYLKKV